MNLQMHTRPCVKPRNLLSGALLPLRNRLHVHLTLPLEKGRELPEDSGLFVAVAVEEVWGERIEHFAFMGQVKNLRQQIAWIERKCLNHGIKHVYFLPDERQAMQRKSLLEMMNKVGFTTVLNVPLPGVPLVFGL